MHLEITTKDRERFEKFVDRSGGPDACHPWTGCRLRRGYGRFRLNGRIEQAHRVAWCLSGRVITPEKPHILHHCDTPPCCNDRCLWDGTDADNALDRARKGRSAKSRSGLPFGAKQRRNGRFGAQVDIGGKKFYFGTYDTAEEASAVALARKRETFP